jgi:hypothetical protein
MCHFCGNEAEWDAWGVGVGPKRLEADGQSIQSMGLVWKEDRILAKRATTPGKGLFFLLL